MKKFYTFLSIFVMSASLAQAQPGNAYDYAGGGDPSTGDYITLPTGIVQPLNGDYTIEFWVYWRGGGDWQRVFDFGTTGDPSSSPWIFFTPQNSLTSTMRFSIATAGNSNAQSVNGTVALPTNSWNHVALVYQSATNTMSIYLNGTLNASGAITLRPSDLGATDENWFGQSQFHPFAFGDPYFNGAIDEFRISTVARYTSNFTPYPVQFTSDASTRALYHFNETSGQTVLDASSNALNGFLGSNAGAVDGNDPSRITNSILPVNIISFAAQKSPDGIELKWRASTTGDPGNFVIEKSIDGVRFQSIGTVSINNASGTANYSFVDRAASTRGKNYYRLRIEELNGPTKFSRIVFVDMDGKNLYQVYPTATSSLVFVQVPKPTRVAIYNSSGVLVKRMFLEQSQGVEVSNFSKGVYQIQFEGTQEMIRFVKM
jgi:hypothetical protein